MLRKVIDLRTVEELARLGLTCADISKVIGVTRPTLYVRLKPFPTIFELVAENGRKKHGKAHLAHDRSAAIRMFNEGKTKGQIAEYFGVSWQSIHNTLIVSGTIQKVKYGRRNQFEDAPRLPGCGVML
jgi:hypothetical protein